MGVRYFLLIGVIVFSIVYPLMYKIDVNFSNTSKPIIIKNGEFFKEKIYGNFKQVEIFKNVIKGIELNLSNGYSFFAKEFIYKKPTLYAKKATYKKDFILKSNIATYNTITKTIKGKKFILIAKDYNASGDSFKIKNNTIFAKNTVFYIKENN